MASRLKWIEPSEREIQNSILYFLNYQSGVFAFQVNTTGTYDARLGYYRKPGRYVLPGTPDILACVRVNQCVPIFVGFECKTDKGRQSAHQKGFELRLKQKSDGFYFIVRSIKDVEEALKLVREKVSLQIAARPILPPAC